MSAGSVSVTITVPVSNLGADVATRASNGVVATLLGQIIEQIQGATAASGTLYWPPGSNTNVGSFTYSPAT